MNLAMSPEKAAEINHGIARFAEAMSVSIRQATEDMGRMAQQVARAFGVPLILVAPEWESRVARAHRHRVESQMRRYRRNEVRRAAVARRHGDLRSAHA